MTTTTCPHCNESIADEIAEAEAALEKKFEGWESAEDIQGLKAALATEREAARKAQRQVKQLKENAEGLTKEKFDELEQIARDGETKNASLLEENKTLKQERDDAVQNFGAAKTTIRDGMIATAVAAAGGNLALLKPALAADLDENATAEQITERVAAMRQDADFQSAFKATTHSGSGSQPGTTGGQQHGGHAGVGWKGKTNRSQFSEREKVDAQKELGLDGYMQIPE